MLANHENPVNRSCTYLLIKSRVGIMRPTSVVEVVLGPAHIDESTGPQHIPHSLERVLLPKFQRVERAFQRCREPQLNPHGYFYIMKKTIYYKYMSVIALNEIYRVDYCYAAMIIMATLSPVSLIIVLTIPQKPSHNLTLLS